MDFVNEGKLDEEQKRRQAEWERVRKPEDPIEAPPEVFDNRSLYDRLKEQHELKKKEFEDSFALKNQVRGIDVDEANFLSECDEARIRREREIRLQEKKEIEDVKITTSSNTVPAAIPKINLTLPAHKKENKQLELLSSAVMTKRKSHPSSTAATALLKSNDLSKGPSEFLTSDRNISGSSSSSDDEPSSTKKQKTKEQSSIAVVGVLPGIGDYDSNSSSESDSSSEDELNTSEVICRESEANSAAARLSKS